MRIKNDNQEAFEMPLVPMIDMMLVLLIFFLVATTLKDTRPELKVDLAAGKASLQVPTDPKVLVISLSRSGARHINGYSATMEELHFRLKEVAAQNRDQPIRLNIDNEVRYQEIVDVLDLCQFEGLKNVGFREP